MGNNNIGILKPYKKEYDYSYVSGAYATIEMVRARPEVVRAVYIHSDYHDRLAMENLCRENKIPVRHDDRAFERVHPKENSYVLGVFDKYPGALEKDRPHIVLVNPGDMGNLGTIIRVAAGFHICNLGIVTPAADVFSPKTIRASMGALFRVNCQQFHSFEQYQGMYGRHRIFPFMLRAETALSPENCPRTDLFSLVFGNEATGLDEDKYKRVGIGIKIPQSTLVDSLNISVAVGIGAFIFASTNGLL